MSAYREPPHQITIASRTPWRRLFCAPLMFTIAEMSADERIRLRGFIVVMLALGYVAWSK